MWGGVNWRGRRDVSRGTKWAWWSAAAPEAGCKDGSDGWGMSEVTMVTHSVGKNRSVEEVSFQTSWCGVAEAASRGWPLPAPVLSICPSLPALSDSTLSYCPLHVTVWRGQCRVQLTFMYLPCTKQKAWKCGWHQLINRTSSHDASTWVMHMQTQLSGRQEPLVTLTGSGITSCFPLLIQLFSWLLFSTTAPGDTGVWHWRCPLPGPYVKSAEKAWFTWKHLSLLTSNTPQGSLTISLGLVVSITAFKEAGDISKMGKNTAQNLKWKLLEESTEGMEKCFRSILKCLTLLKEIIYYPEVCTWLSALTEASGEF